MSTLRGGLETALGSEDSCCWEGPGLPRARVSGQSAVAKGLLKDFIGETYEGGDCPWRYLRTLSSISLGRRSPHRPLLRSI